METKRKIANRITEFFFICCVKSKSIAEVISATLLSFLVITIP